MRCPKDDTDLIEIERQGIGIDYCPTCKGVWLERHELDELINRSIAISSNDRDDDDRPPRRESRERSRGFMDRARDMFDDDRDDFDSSRRRRDKYSDERDDDDRYYKGKKKKSKRGMLEDLLDF